MREEDEALAYIIRLLEDLQVDYAVGGSLASAHYGEPRATLDADIVADLNLAQLGAALSRLPANEFYFNESAAKEALQIGGQFNLIHIATSFKIDIFIASNWETKQQLARARVDELLPGLRARISQPEDLILKKLEYYQMGESPKHLRDIAAMIQISGPEIDLAYIDREAERLGLAELWAAIRQRAENG